ncbi:PREDICTED: zinc finger CCCH domain-containing protein 39-like [Ipomoea nil]|uniref:zinc finger CCCH domain-containing protein 39-like n=1 Tax=Ipomoea nil TaxID=35883 RepID=UPI00090091AD|nr:PREDICTED: zinc finger CCCH domain-containing protein 39-like [Ipomoea nil]
MSFPDPPPPILLNQEQSELNPQFDHAPPFKRRRNSENNQLSSASFPPMNPRVNLPNIPGKGTGHIFYKTRVCAKFLEGKCRNGEHCTFAHGADDLREPPPNWQDLVREKDRVAGSWNDDQKIIPRVKICKKFYNGEECPYGENCNFLHERPPKFRSDMVKDRMESNAITIGTTNCITARRSDSDQLESHKHASADPDIHRPKLAFWKKRLCSKYEIMGQCPFGERCHYAHGQSELQAFSGRSDTGEATNFPPVPIEPLSIAAAGGDSFRANQVAWKDEQGAKKFHLWKLTKKISGIYGDWIDEANPPHLLV